MVHTEWIDAFRRTAIGVLLIGRFFVWGDIACCLIGIALAALFEKRVLKPDGA